MYFPFFVNYAEPTELTISVKKFFVEWIYTPKSIAFAWEVAE